MKKHISLFAIVLFATFSYSQNFNWVKTFGGIESDISWDLTIDESNNIYTVGRFKNAINFDGSSGSSSLISNGASDIYFKKLNSLGEHIWSKSIGGTKDDEANRIILDTQNNLIVGGSFRTSMDFDPGSDIHILNNDSGQDQFILKLDNDGEFIWVNHVIGGSIFIKDMTTDLDGNILVTGRYTHEIHVEVNGQIQSLTTSPSGDAYIQKIDTEGNTLWLKTFGGQALESSESIRVDSEGNVYCAGTFNESTDFDPSNATFNLQSEGEYDIFILKLDNNGDFLWAQRMGTPNYDLGPTIEIMSNDNIYVESNFDGKLFVHSFDNSGNLNWEKEISGSSTDYISGAKILVNSENDFFLTGGFIGTIDFDPSDDTHILSTGSNIDGEADCFIGKYNKEGELVWIQKINDTSGSGSETGRSLGLNSNKDLFLLGNFNIDLNINAGNFSFSKQTTGASDIFLANILDLPTSVDEELIIQTVTIFPNPSTGMLNVKFEENFNKNIDVKVFNSSGESVFQTQIIDKNSNLDLTNLPNGTYVIQLKSDSREIFNQTIVIQKP